MPNPTFASKRTDDIFARTPSIKFFVEKKRVVRLGSAFLIWTLLVQGVLILPPQQAKASSRSSNSVSILQSFDLVDRLENFSDKLLSSIPGLGSMSGITDHLLSKIDASTILNGEQIDSIGKKVSSQFSSILAFFIAPNHGKSKTSNSASSMFTAYPNILYDFDEDGFSDIGTWRQSNADFTVRNSSNSTLATYDFGSSSSAVAAPGDFNGDGATDAAVFAAGTWTYKTAPSATPQTISLGTTGDVPVAGDYDGNGTTDAAVYTPGSSATWKYKPNASATPVPLSCVTTCGTTGDIPVSGNYDGDSDTDIAVFRPSNGNWYISYTGGGGTTFHWGQSGDIPLQGDFDGDGKSDPAVYRPGNGAWYWANSSTSYATSSYRIWGSYADQPVPGNYLGDNRTDFVVWRPTTGIWHIMENVTTEGMFAVEPLFDQAVLGAVGDQAIESAYIKQIGNSVSGDVLGPLRLKATNATGGTNLNSQNFGWSSSLVSLPGRTGMDLNMGIGYNSLVWIKNGSTMYFDPDISTITPGFRFGFPVIEPVYYDSTKAKWTYMMVTTSGARVEFRQQGAGSTYETYDSSYTQLVTAGASNPNDPIENITITVKTTDGTQMSYEWIVGAFRCTKILDRNGNYVSITYDSTDGLLQNVVDTLGRTINVSYNEYLLPSEITQTWKTSNGAGSGTTTHKWAEFTYTTKATDYEFDSSITSIVGPPSGWSARVLDKIKYADGTATKFDYNFYLQVSKVSTIAADSSSHVLNYVSTNLDSPSPDQTDCPRFTETRTKAEDFNSGSEVVINNSRTASQSFSLSGGALTGTGALIKTWVNDHPNNLRSWSYVGESGWKEGLPLASQDCITTGSSCTTLVRWSWNDWEQDIYGGTTPAYMCNPRVKETRIGDGTSTKKTTSTFLYRSDPEIGMDDFISYFGLVDESSILDGSTVLKTQKNTYVTSSNYVNRRIIGLPEETKLYQGTSSAGSLMSKVTYAYDGESLASLSSATNHDTTNYGTGFAYRGNLTETKRWDVTAHTNGSLAVASQLAYNIAGSPVSQTDPLGRVTSISYTDSWNDSVSRTTYAYPTTVTDPADNSSTIKYRFDFGANVWARSPTPYDGGTSTNTYGKTTSRIYEDTTGRISKEIIENLGGAYTRYAYNTNGKEVTSYSTIVDIDNDQADTDDEVETLTVTDGAGRVIKTRTVNPNSSGGYIGKKVTYDILGRVIEESVPTETNSSLTPSGDDSGSWKLNKTEYDWQGRPTRTIPSDSTGSDGKDTLISYAGCGCAGGLVTTIKGPEVTGYNAAGTLETIAKRRMQEIHADILGRTEMIKLFDFYENSPSTPYRTTKTTYNGRDQATLIREYSGSESSTTYQDTTMSYDGHGRPSTLHKPEWYGSTTTTYNADDTVATVTDPRGAVATYTYENVTGTPKRPLVTTIAYATPSPNATPSNSLHIPDAPTVTFTYDDAGNRTQMTDGSGTSGYFYDELSRLKWETKNFSDYSSVTHTLIYDYHLAGSLKSIIDPSDRVTIYSADILGRTTAIEGGGNSSLTSYATDIEYRAFGGVKEMKMSTTAQTTVELTYDSALRPTAYTAGNSVANIHDAAYTYGYDGMTKDVTNNINHKFDQKNVYDFATRLKKNDVGSTSTGYPFTQVMGYDAFNNLTSRSNSTYGQFDDAFSASYSGNRKVPYSGGTSDIYDHAGNVVESFFTATSCASDCRSYNDEKKWRFDAAGRVVKSEHTGPWSTFTNVVETTYDGDGRPVKVDEVTQANGSIPWHYIYSSVTGQKINDLISGKHVLTNVYMGGSVIAEEWSDSTANFQVTDPVTGSVQKISGDGSVPSDSGPDDIYPNHSEIAGMDMLVPRTEPTAYPRPPRRRGFGGDSEWGCIIDGMEMSVRACTNLIGNRGFVYSETWQQKHEFTAPPGVNGPTTSWAVETYMGSWWQLESYSMTSWNFTPEGAAGGQDFAYETTQTKPRPKRKSAKQKRTPLDIVKLKTAISFCAQKMFDVELVGDVTWSGKGTTGTMNFQVINGGTVPYLNDADNTVSAVSTFAVNNVTNTFSFAQMRAAGLTWKPEGTYRGWHGIFGATGRFVNTSNFRVQTNTNFTASDLDRIRAPLWGAEMWTGLEYSNFMKVQIHETGNSLALITGWNNHRSSLSGDDDNGAAFESCVVKNYKSLLAGGELTYGY